jgi:hypothetical protein
MKKASIDTTTSFRQSDSTRVERIGIELIETSYQCRMGDSKERKLGETEISAREIKNPDITETLSCVEASIVAPKELAFDAAFTVSRDNLNSVTEKNNEPINKKSHFHLDKDIPSPIGESCRIRDGEKRKEVGTLKSLTSHLINPVATETMNSVETSAFEPERLVFSLALANLDNNLDFVVEKQDESRDDSQGFVLESKPWHPNSKSSGMRNCEEKIEDVDELAKMLSPQITAQELTCTPNIMLYDAAKLKIPIFSDSGDRHGTVSAKEIPSPKRIGLSCPRETEAVVHAHNSLVPDGVRSDEERNEEIGGLVSCSAPHIVNTELNGSPHCINNEVQDTCFPPIEGFQQIIKPSVGLSSDMREVGETFYAGDSYSPICDVGCNNETTELNGPTFISKLGTELDQSPSKKEMGQESLLLPQPIGEVLDLSDKRKHSLTSCFYEASRQTSSLSGGSFASCRSHQKTPLDIVGHSVETPKSVSTNLKPFGTNPKSEREGSLVKNGEGIKHLSSGGRYFLRSSARQEKSNASVSKDGIVIIGGLKSSGQVFHVDANSWPKRRKVEIFSDFATATSPRPRKRPVHSKV